MAVLNIYTYPDDVLRRRAEPVSDVNAPDFQELITDMVETMYEAPGIGLAAPQVGVSRRLCVVDITSGEDPAALLVLVNPEITEVWDKETREEGCLSVPGFYYEVTRPSRIAVRFQDRHGRPVELLADGLLARAIQHEIDHLNGVLFVDRLGLVKKELFKRRYRQNLSETAVT